MNKLLNAIKEASLQSTDESKPTGFFFGEVISVDPLTVNVEQKFTITEEFLTLTHAVKDYYVDITVSHYTVNDKFLVPDHTHPCSNCGKTKITQDFDTTHKHAYKGKKKIMLHHGLKVGEKVMLLRVQGGQNYIIIDRIDDPICEGEWI